MQTLTKTLVAVLLFQFTGCAYMFHGGDDYEEHSKLPSHIPTDFPTTADKGMPLAIPLPKTAISGLTPKNS